MDYITKLPHCLNNASSRRLVICDIVTRLYDWYSVKSSMVFRAQQINKSI